MFLTKVTFLPPGRSFLYTSLTNKNPGPLDPKSETNSNTGSTSPRASTVTLSSTRVSGVSNSLFAYLFCWLKTFGFIHRSILRRSTIRKIHRDNFWEWKMTPDSPNPAFLKFTSNGNQWKWPLRTLCLNQYLTKIVSVFAYQPSMHGFD